MTDVQFQSSGFFLELSPDWLILRASENVHKFLGEYHVTLIGEPLASFAMAQPLHDLRNRLSRQRSASGIARAYRVRLIDEPRYFDMAFQHLDDRILLEGVPAIDGFGGALGAVSRLIDGLDGKDMLDSMESAARRMRALTGFDRVTLTLGSETVVSSRGKYPELPGGDLPPILANSREEPIAVFPRDATGSDIGEALLKSPSAGQLGLLREHGVASAICVPVLKEGEEVGRFVCDNRTAREPEIELHAAAELFAQIFALKLP